MRRGRLIFNVGHCKSVQAPYHCNSMHERVFPHRQSSEINGIIVDFPRRSLIQQNACRCRNFHLEVVAVASGWPPLVVAMSWPGGRATGAARVRIHEQHARRLGDHRDLKLETPLAQRARGVLAMPVNQDPVEMQSTPPSILCCAAPPR